jgi:hypothetical protein
MLITTETAIRSILSADPSVPPDERTRIMAAIRSGGAKPESAERLASMRLMRRNEVARLLGRTTRSVDLLACEGVLKRVSLPGRSRAAGFRESDVLALIAENHAT